MTLSHSEKSCDLTSEKAESSPRKLNSPTCSQTSSSYRLNGHKEKRQPTITPRKFTRFFTPRSHGPIASSSRRALEDITAPVNNRNGIQSSPIRSAKPIAGQDNSPTIFTRDLKRRKLLHTPSPSPENSSPAKAHSIYQPQVSDDEDPKDRRRDFSSPYWKNVEDGVREHHSPSLKPTNASLRHIRQLDTQGISGQLLQLNIGFRSTHSRRRSMWPVSDWQDQTASFYSRPEDTHFCTSIGSSIQSIPFCTASCNTNTLVAVGDEEGQIRLLESAKDGSPPFKDYFLAFRPHSNAIIDMCFSLDDSLLASASGDQTAKVVDMATQRTISVLSQHSASLKQVRFQPGAANNSVLATSSRDGSVQIWDLRCKGTDGPVQDFHIPMDSSSVTQTNSRKSPINYGCVTNSIYNAHRPGLLGRPTQPAASKDGPSRGELPGRIGDVSVTAIAFLPEGQEHMLLTACEANASVKLWDVRSLHNTRRRMALPLSCTVQPESHSQWRHFGINSLNLSGDGSRLYTLCRDNTVYAYSTAHLVLGQAPDHSRTNTWRRRQQVEVQDGLGPLYGFRHPQLHATSFYVKSAIRPAKAGRSEMLAVGSCDGCAILFPTDERYLKMPQDASQPKSTTLPRLRRSGSNLSSSPRISDSIPISENGTPLIRGHDREVGALTWTSEGELVTVGDDFLVRCWREGGDNARKLRMGGEQGGQRWGCGWASVPELYDDDEDQ